MLDAQLRDCLTDSVQRLDLLPSPETPQPRSVSGIPGWGRNVLTKSSGSDLSFRSSLILQIPFPPVYPWFWFCYLLGGIRGRMALLSRPLGFRWSYINLYFPLSFLRAPALGRPAFFPGSPSPIARPPASCQAGSSAAFQSDLPFSPPFSSSAILGVPSLEHVGVRYYGNCGKRNKLMKREHEKIYFINITQI